MEMEPKKILFIELDGASWNVLDPLLAQGRLPNLQRLMDRGVSGDLLSDPPLISPRLWVSIFSGKHSRKHGVGFFGTSSTAVRCKRIWDIFNEKGHPVGVFGSFVTWPPSPVNGFMIPSLFALGTDTHPEEYRFLQEITLMERKKGKAMNSGGANGRRSILYYARKMKEHGVSLKTLWDAGRLLAETRLRGGSADDRYWRKATIHMRISAEIFRHLYRSRRPVFATFHIHLCDALSHRYWKYYEPEKFPGIDPRQAARYGDVIPQAYEAADRIIGDFVQEAGKDAVVMVMSDHGSRAMEVTRTSYRLQVENFLQRFGLREHVIPAHVGLMTFCYFKDESMTRRMLAALGKVVFADTGKRVFDVREEEGLLGIRLSQVFWGEEIPGDRKMDLGEFGSCVFADLFLPHRMEVSGTHQREGMMVFAGPGVKQGERLSGATIFDVTPTALVLAGFPVAEDMDGAVLTDALDETFLREHPVRRIPTYEGPTLGKEEKGEEVTYDQVKGRLESLGYL